MQLQRQWQHEQDLAELRFKAASMAALLEERAQALAEAHARLQAGDAERQAGEELVLELQARLRYADAFSAMPAQVRYAEARSLSRLS